MDDVHEAYSVDPESRDSHSVGASAQGSSASNAHGTPAYGVSLEGFVELRIGEARNLPPRKYGGLPDPYCVASLHEATENRASRRPSPADFAMKARHFVRPMYTSATVMQDLNPRWGEAVTLASAFFAAADSSEVQERMALRRLGVRVCVCVCVCVCVECGDLV